MKFISTHNLKQPCQLLQGRKVNVTCWKILNEHCWNTLILLPILFYVFKNGIEIGT